MASPAYATYSKEELLALLRSGKEGIQCWNSLISTFSHQERKRIDLSGADLRKCDLSDADLCGINLRGAVLEDANFNRANLLQTNFRDADLRGADLSGVKTRLLPRQLAGTDLTCANLPEPLERFYEKLGSVNEVSDRARTLFLALGAGCLYSWLTIATTKDLDLITNRVASPLPIIQAAVPIVGFYVVTPIVLGTLYLYFHFHMQKLWEELACFPAVFPDGQPLYIRAYQSIFTDMVQAHFPRLRADRPFLSYFQQWTFIILAWWGLPITLLFFWGRYLPRHDPFWTLVLASVLATSIICAIQLYRLARETIRGDERVPFRLKSFLKRRRSRTDTLRGLFIVATVVMISMGAIFGIPKDAQSSNRSPRTWVPHAMGWLGYYPFANLSYAELSLRPPGWTGQKAEELDRVKAANLNHRSLRYAQAEHAFLAKAFLGDADLTGAHLENADLQRAYLVRADLTGGHFEAVSMEGADLSDATLWDAHLKDARLTGANLRGADLTRANLEGAVIDYAELRGAKGLNPDTIRTALAWRMAFYDADLLNKLGLCEDHNFMLQEAKKRRPSDFRSWETKWYETGHGASLKCKPNPDF